MDKSCWFPVSMVFDGVLDFQFGACLGERVRTRTHTEAADRNNSMQL